MKTMAFNLVALLFVLSGCHQRLIVHVDRLKTVNPDEIPEWVSREIARRAQSLNPEEGIAAAKRNIQSAFRALDKLDPQSIRNNKPTVDNLRSMLNRASLQVDEKNLQGAIQSLYSVESAATNLQESLSNVRTVEPSNQPLNQINILESRDDGMRNMNGNIKLVAAKQSSGVVKESAKAARIRISAVFGGYSSKTMYVIADGSHTLKRLKSREEADEKSRRTKILDVKLVGDSTLVAVQHLPTHVTIRNAQGDPTKLLTNSLFLINRGLRVAAMYVPLMSPLSEVAPTIAQHAGTDSAAKNKKISEDEANAEIEALTIRVNAILNDGKLQEILRKIAASPSVNPLSIDEEAYLRQKLGELAGAGGVTL